MSLLDRQIRKAEDRARGLDLRRLAAEAKGKPPAALGSPQSLDDRRRMLAETRGDQADNLIGFERLIAGNELQPVNYLAHGAVAARSVCRLNLFTAAGDHCGFATGFLVAPTILLTNYHVFPSAAAAQGSIAQFDAELEIFDRLKPVVEFALRPDQLRRMRSITAWSPSSRPAAKAWHWTAITICR